MMHGQKNIEF